MAFHKKAAHAGPVDSHRLVRRMLAILLVLVMGICCYSVTVMAWFEDQTVNAGNTIRTGEFAARIVLEDAAGSVLWSSDTKYPDGIQYYGEDIVLAGGAPARLRIYSHARSNLAFQYQIRLTAHGSVWEKTIDAEENALILEPAGDEEYPLNFPEGTDSLRLDFRTAFQKSSIAPLPSLTTATAAPTTAARPASPAPAAPKTSAADESTVTTTAPATTTATAATAAETAPLFPVSGETTVATDAAEETGTTDSCAAASQTVSASGTTSTTSSETTAGSSDETAAASTATDSTADSAAVSSDSTAAASDAEGA